MNEFFDFNRFFGLTIYFPRISLTMLDSKLNWNSNTIIWYTLKEIEREREREKTLKFISRASTVFCMQFTVVALLSSSAFKIREREKDTNPNWIETHKNTGVRIGYGWKSGTHLEMWLREKASACIEWKIHCICTVLPRLISMRKMSCKMDKMVYFTRQGYFICSLFPGRQPSHISIHLTIIVMC